MKPGGHLATAAALSGVGYAVTGSLGLAAGCFAGGFLIDSDHYLDYLVFDGQWRHPSPTAFLRYAFTYRYKRLVQPLHSVELLAVLGLLAVTWPHPALVGYILGSLLHLSLDILVNGEHILRQPVLFYCFFYRARRRFAADRLVGRLVLPPGAGQAPVREFFTWRLRAWPVDGEPDEQAHVSERTTARNK
ncbi:MAG: hypothetical protein HY613_04190 [Candidatus Rokubacteria bacterium]|nr:hypothetical protein [Candidatus Rokubacteria bacterium]